MIFESVLTTDTLTLVQGLICTGTALVLGVISSLVYRFTSSSRNSLTLSLAAAAD